METRDLTSYKSGYDEYCEQSKVPSEEYSTLEAKIEIYEKAIENIEMGINENCSSEQKIQFVRAFLEELSGELGKC